ITFSLSDTSYNYEWVGFGISDAELTLESMVDFTVQVQIDLDSACPDVALFIDVTFDPNPLSIDCSGLVGPICNNGDALPLPDLSSSDPNWEVADGQWVILDVDSNIVINDPSAINPETLGIGDYTVHYTWSDANGCSHHVECPFTIGAPQQAVIDPLEDLPCYGILLDFNESNGNIVEWSVSGCNNIMIDSLGVINTADCPEGTTLTVGAAGNCIISTSVQVTILELPQIEVGVNSELCVNECYTIAFDQAVDVQYVVWTAGLDEVEETYCPEDFGVVAGDQIELCAVATHENGCAVTDCLTLDIQGLPDLNALPDSICQNATLDIPSCPSCTVGGNITIVHQTNPDIEDVVLPFPGTLSYDFSAPGDYTYTITGELEECSTEVTGEVHVISLTALDIIQPEYDDCLINYEVNIEMSGEDSTWYWSDSSIDQTLAIDNEGNITFTIEYPDTSDINFNYIDILFLENQCSSVEEVVESMYTAPPGFSVDNDSIVCSGTEMAFIIDLLYPVTVDQFTIWSDYPGFEQLEFEGVPPDSIFVLLETDNSQQQYSFFFEAVNHCSSVLFESVVYVYPADLVYDVELFYDVPLCFGDTIVAELVENFGQESAIEFTNLDEGHLTFENASGDLFTFNVLCY
ncbi:MAG: hypothetical protein KDC12_15780, partial [Flavobacteriales bacterium]|nr:hypothetical protein [Flavobacteriales bacterium]